MSDLVLIGVGVVLLAVGILFVKKSFDALKLIQAKAGKKGPDEKLLNAEYAKIVIGCLIAIAGFISIIWSII